MRGGNHPPCTHLDPVSTSSITRSCTIGTRPRAHGAYRVGDPVRSPFFDPQSWDISGRGHRGEGGTSLPVPILTSVVHPPLPDPTQLGRDSGHTGHIVSAIIFVPPFSTPNPGIYRVGVTDEWGEPPSLYPLSEDKLHGGCSGETEKPHYVMKPSCAWISARGQTPWRL